MIDSYTIPDLSGISSKYKKVIFINIKEYRDEKLLVGYSNGKLHGENLKEYNNDILYVIMIPSNIRTLTKSYFHGFFEDVIDKYTGRFMDHFKFNSTCSALTRNRIESYIKYTKQRKSSSKLIELINKRN